MEVYNAVGWRQSHLDDKLSTSSAGHLSSPHTTFSQHALYPSITSESVDGALGSGFGQANPAYPQIQSHHTLPSYQYGAPQVQIAASTIASAHPPGDRINGDITLAPLSIANDASGEPKSITKFQNTNPDGAFGIYTSADAPSRSMGDSYARAPSSSPDDNPLCSGETSNFAQNARLNLAARHFTVPQAGQVDAHYAGYGFSVAAAQYSSSTTTTTNAAHDLNGNPASTVLQRSASADDFFNHQHRQASGHSSASNHGQSAVVSHRASIIHAVNRYPVPPSSSARPQLSSSMSSGSLGSHKQPNTLYDQRSMYSLAYDSYSAGNAQENEEEILALPAPGRPVLSFNPMTSNPGSGWMNSTVHDPVMSDSPYETTFSTNRSSRSLSGSSHNTATSWHGNLSTSTSYSSLRPESSSAERPSDQDLHGPFRSVSYGPGTFLSNSRRGSVNSYSSYDPYSQSQSPSNNQNLHSQEHYAPDSRTSSIPTTPDMSRQHSKNTFSDSAAEYGSRVASGSVQYYIPVQSRSTAKRWTRKEDHLVPELDAFHLREEVPITHSWARLPSRPDSDEEANALLKCVKEFHSNYMQAAQQTDTLLTGHTLHDTWTHEISFFWESGLWLS
jgi:hypothetical protein